MSFRTKALTGAAAASIAIATPFIAKHEGLRLTPYQDIGGVWTVCYGETEIEMREYTEEECNAIFNQRLIEFQDEALVHVKQDIPITMRAAVVSFAYNVGTGAFQRSTMLRKINAGDFWGACEELDRWVYVGKMWIKGLANRREAEKRLCVAELSRDA